MELRRKSFRKLALMVLLLAFIAAGLTACKDKVENQGSPTQTTSNANPNANEQYSPQEQIIGVVLSIDEMILTVDTAGISRVTGTGEPQSSGGSNERQEFIIRLTEQTAIQVNEITTTAGGGQTTGMRAGTLDDLIVQAVVMAEVAWQDNEYIVISLIIMPPISG